MRLVASGVIVRRWWPQLSLFKVLGMTDRKLQPLYKYYEHRVQVSGPGDGFASRCISPHHQDLFEAQGHGLTRTRSMQGWYGERSASEARRGVGPKRQDGADLPQGES